MLCDMEQFEAAVRYLLSPESDAGTQRQALAYLEQVKASAEGLVVCAQAFASGSQVSEEARFQCLVVIVHIVQNRFGDLNADEKQCIKALIATWMGSCASGTCTDPPHLRNKMAQLVTLVFVQEYPQEWLDFFVDIMNPISSGGCLYYDVFLRILETIHELVVDREMPHTAEELQRNAFIKDSMRATANGMLADAWYHGLSTYATSSPETARRCLVVVSQYIAWINIDLIVNERFIPLLFNLTRTSLEVRAASCDALRAIVLKGMDGQSKVALLQSLNLVEFGAAVFPTIKDDEDEENAFGIAVASLHNSLGIMLISSCTKMHEGGMDTGDVVQLIETAVQRMLPILGSEYDDISEELLPFAQAYLHFIKDGGPPPPERRKNVSALLHTVISKMRYDPEFDFTARGDQSDTEFEEFRRSLQVLFCNICAQDQELFLEVVTTVVARTLGTLPVTGAHGVHFTDVELALHVVFLCGECVPGQHFNPPARSGKDKGAAAGGEGGDLRGSPHGGVGGGSMSMPGRPEMIELMQLVTNGSVVMHPHSAVTLMYMDVVSRMGKFFRLFPDRLPNTLRVFLGDAGIHNSASAHVRSRACYHFMRFVKMHVRDHLGPYMGDILQTVQRLITVGDASFIDYDDQLFLCESLGLLVTSAAVPADDQSRVLDAMMSPLLEEFLLVHAKLLTEQDLGRQRQMAVLIKAGCAELFARALQIFMGSMQIPANKEIVRGAVRTYMHRMIVCMGEGILPIVPASLGAMLDVDNCQNEDIRDFMPLITQIIMKFKTKVAPVLADFFLPVVQATLTLLRIDVDPADENAKADQVALRRCYYEFLNCCISNSLSGVLVAPKNAPHTPEILSTVLQGGIEFKDPQSQKICFNMLQKLIRLWLGKADVGLVGFDDFVFTQIVPACFQSVLKPDFNPDDGWSYLVLGEIAALLMATYSVAGSTLVQFLQNVYFPSIPLPQDTVADIFSSLDSGEKPKLRQCLKQLSHRLVAR